MKGIDHRKLPEDGKGNNTGKGKGPRTALVRVSPGINAAKRTRSTFCASATAPLKKVPQGCLRVPRKALLRVSPGSNGAKRTPSAFHASATTALKKRLRGCPVPQRGRRRPMQRKAHTSGRRGGEDFGVDTTQDLEDSELHAVDEVSRQCQTLVRTLGTTARRG